ncbi:MAG: N-acetylmuramoyl-L-alanine amidase [Elusimicrobiales bacterium]
MKMSSLAQIVLAAALAAGAAAAGEWDPVSGYGDNSLGGGMESFRQTMSRASEQISSTMKAGAGKKLVCIDPGHPSPFNSGYEKQNGTTETHINWVVAEKLKKALEGKGVRVMMTKSEERQLVDNQDRAVMSNKAADKFFEENSGGVALVVHLHCDTGPHNGFAVYYPDRKGKYTGVSGDEPNIGFTGPTVGIQESSKQLAGAVESAMSGRLSGKVKSNGVKGDSKTAVGGRQGALTFSIFSKIPTITVEMVTLSSKRDVEFIKTESGQQQMAQAIADGLIGY